MPKYPKPTYEDGRIDGRGEVEADWVVAMGDVIPPEAEVDVENPDSVAEYIQKLLELLKDET